MSGEENTQALASTHEADRKGEAYAGAWPMKNGWEFVFIPGSDPGKSEGFLMQVIVALNPQSVLELSEYLGIAELY